MKTLGYLLIAAILLMRKNKPKATKADLLEAYINGKTVMCSRHMGNSVLLWTDGALECYECRNTM